MNTDKHGLKRTSRFGIVRRVIPYIAVIIGIIVGVFLFPFHPSEPFHGGRRISDWLAKAESSADAIERDAATAEVRTIGTNAIPWLLAELELPLPIWKHRLNQRLSQQNLVTFRFDTDEYFVRQERALAGFRALGSDARCAIPALAKLNRKNPNAPGPLHALACCGSEAIPFLWYSLTNDQSRIAPGQAALAIRGAVFSGHMPISEAVTFIPTLRELLNSTNAYITNKAYITLELIQEKTKENPTNANGGVFR